MAKLIQSDSMPADAIPVLDYGFVALVDKMGTDLTITNSARVSFGKKSVEFSDNDAKIINYLAEHEHTSPFRHAVLQFHIKAPEFIMRQAYKHVVGCEWTSGEGRFVDTGWNEISGRYAEYEPEFYIPDKFRPQSKDNKQASADGDLSKVVTDGFDWDYDSREPDVTVRKQYTESINQSYLAYKQLLKHGVSKEQARCLLPVSFYTEVYWTCSLQAAVHFVKLRQHAGAQYEIQQYAEAIDSLIVKAFPVSVEALKKHL